uniref:GPI inositol-deacylase n=1 Tax=Heliothis virescens TaxID=7102 RepID=A0A2A4JLI3_HELVI
MAVSDVIAQDGAHGNVKLHPYLVTLVRWCVSCVWGTATVLLHRLLTAPALPIAPSKPAARSRAAGSEHLHPEPRVCCEVLHAPERHQLDVVFVHGLYGSLGNTWRQGEWRTKYKLDPPTVTLRSHSPEPCDCTRPRPAPPRGCTSELNGSVIDQLSGCFTKILPNENSLITEKFYNNTLISSDNYQTQAKFVSELFRNDCDNTCDDDFKCNDECVSECKCASVRKGAKCEPGCGCVCDECYSHCWPRDWIKEDFPGARVISINYTSDPYLWRPLWIKGNKRLTLQERAAQMTSQLVALGVGRRPVVWVGHSKGGLFIKQIYCDAYEEHLKMENIVAKQQPTNNNSEEQTNRQYNKNIVHNIDSMSSRCSDDETGTRRKEQTNSTCNTLLNNFIQEQNNAGCATNGETTLRSIDEMNDVRNNNNSGNSSFNEDEIDLDVNCNEEQGTYGCTQNGDVLDNKQARSSDKSDFIDVSDTSDQTESAHRDVTDKHEDMSSNNEEDSRPCIAGLWRASAGFMFYSVPHRGSPLADIKTPITCRSVELQEIAKDCPLVLDLHSRWLRAVCGAGEAGAGAGGAGGAGGRPLVRSVVETCRTLMSVLWLRIVSEDSADAGVGTLLGVAVDHREVCKPASRRCALYAALAGTIRAALHRCHCQQ